MDPLIINPSDLWQVIVACAGGVITLAGAGAIFASVIHKLKAPNKKQDERIAALEDNVKKIEDRLVLGNKRFEDDTNKVLALETSMKETNKIIMESLQALTAHAIDGNNIEQLKNAERALNHFLIEKV